MELVQVTGTSKKTGKQFTGYQLQIGKFKGPLMFPSEIEIDYIQNYLAGKK